jgi:Holliday junction resolvase-like predicted endonuclease
MDEKTWLGTLAEAKATVTLIQQGFTVFTSASGKAPFDLIAYRDGRMYRIEVKGTSGASPTPYGSIEVKISTTRSNRTTNTLRRFDASKSDILAVYVHSFDAVCFFPSRLLDGRTYINLRTVPNRTRNRLASWVIADHLELSFDDSA